MISNSDNDKRQIAKYLDRKHGQSWSDDRIFNEAKKWVIATYQHIAIDEWLPSWIGEKLPPYKGMQQIKKFFGNKVLKLS